MPAFTNNQIPLIYPTNYVNGFQLAWGSNTTLTVTSGQCRDGSDSDNSSVSTASTTINLATNGLNGLDQGSLANSTWYYIFEIFSSSSKGPFDTTSNIVAANPSGFIASTSSTAPLLPAGYDGQRLIGYWLTDGSAHLLKGYVLGNGNHRLHFWDAQISVLSGGSATSFTAVSLAGAVPPISQVLVRMGASFTPNAAGDTFSLRPTGSSVAAANCLAGSGDVATKAQVSKLNQLAFVSSGNASIDYVGQTSDALTLTVEGFDYFI